MRFLQEIFRMTAPHFRMQDTSLSGCIIIESIVAEDERGCFGRTYSAAEFAAIGLDVTFIESSVSKNPRAGTLRGLHFQAAPYEEIKLVSCSRGRIFDVAVDLRAESETFGRWTAVELSADRLQSLYIPKGMAHGFMTLEANTDVRYEMSVSYRPDAARGVRWDDAEIGIAWPDVGELTMSHRDRNLPTLADLDATLSPRG